MCSRFPLAPRCKIAISCEKNVVSLLTQGVTCGKSRFLAKSVFYKSVEISPVPIVYLEPRDILTCWGDLWPCRQRSSSVGFEAVVTGVGFGGGSLQLWPRPLPGEVSRTPLGFIANFGRWEVYHRKSAEELEEYFESCFRHWTTHIVRNNSWGSRKSTLEDLSNVEERGNDIATKAPRSRGLGPTWANGDQTIPAET